MKTALDIFETLDRLNKKEASADKIAVAACMLCDFFGAEIRAALAPKPAPPQADTPIKGAGDLDELKSETKRWAYNTFIAVPDEHDQAVIDATIDRLAEQGHITAQREDVWGAKLCAVEHCPNNADGGHHLCFFHSCNQHTRDTPAPIDAEVREALADVELCMRDYAYDPLLGRKLRKHLKTIRAALKKGGRDG